MPVRPPFAMRAAMWAGLLLAAAACVRNTDYVEARTPMEKARILLTPDLSGSESARRAASLRSGLSLPWIEARRVHGLSNAFDRAASSVGRRAQRFHRVATERVSLVGRHLTHLWQEFPSPPSPDEVARTLARDIERAGYVLGLERRPLGEPTDFEHRVDPDDDRPVATWWERVRRRILP